MVGWHRWLNGHEFKQAPGDGEGQGGLACRSPWGHTELETTEWLNNNSNMRREPGSCYSALNSDIWQPADQGWQSPFLTWLTSWWGDWGFLGLFFLTDHITGIVILCRKEWNPSEVSVYNQGKSWQKKTPKPHGEDTGSSVLSWLGLSLSQIIFVCPWSSPDLQGNSLPSLPPEAENQPPSPALPTHLILFLLLPLPIDSAYFSVSALVSSASVSRCFSLFWCVLSPLLLFFFLSALTLLFIAFPHPILPSIFTWTTGPKSFPSSALV